MLLILFGVPGAGKTYVGRIVQEAFGFTFHDADHELPDDMRAALKNKLTVTDDMRTRFFDRIVEKTRQLQAAHEHVAIAQTFLKEAYRERMLRELPGARFIWVQSQPELIEARFLQRSNYLIDIEQARRMAGAFDLPRIPHHVIMNTNGRDSVVQQIDAVLKDLRRLTL
jgi:gluconokinase